MRSVWGIIIFIVGFIFGAVSFCNNKPKVLKEVVVDTVPFYDPVPVFDKIVETKIKKVPFSVHDTVLTHSIRTVTVHDTVYLVIDRVQQHYSKQGSYDAWISGVDSNLDSIKVYNTTVTNTIIPKNRNKLSFYFQADYLHSSSTFALGHTGLEWETPSGLSLHGGYGCVLQDSKFYHGPEVGLKYKFNFLK